MIATMNNDITISRNKRRWEKSAAGPSTPIASSFEVTQFVPYTIASYIYRYIYRLIYRLNQSSKSLNVKSRGKTGPCIYINVVDVNVN